MPYLDKEKQLKAQRISKRNQNFKRRIRVVEMLGGKCVDCGNNNFRVLQLDHKLLLRRPRVNNGKTVGTGLVNQILCGKVDKDTIELRCANCHVIRTYEMRTEFGNYIQD